VSQVNLEVIESPHESHSWQYVIGNVLPSSAYYSRGTPVPRSSRSRYLDPSGLEPESFGPVPSSRITTTPPALQRVSADRTPAVPYAEMAGLTRLDPGRAGHELRQILQAGSAQPITADLSDPFTQLYRFSSPGGYPVRSARRQFL